ncbi:MAG TPA: FAD-dependent oxidoreductase [Acidimicrobiia bacterium]|jgi:ribulose 1,5-bisphosphate synthetase/thiazole synthase
MPAATMRVSARDADVVLDVDVVVCGAGPAGMGAALAAARGGATVALVERYGCFGGNLTVAEVGTICGLYLRDGPGSFAPVTGGIAREFARDLLDAGSGLGPYPFKDTAVFLYVPWAAKRLADHLLTETEAAQRITPLLHALVSDVVLDDDTHAIRGVVIASKQGPKVVAARVVIDATGDADVAVAAGTSWAMGDPGLRQFGSMQFVIQHAADDAVLAGGPGALAQAVAAHGAHLSRDGGALIPTFRPGEVLGAMVRVGRHGEPLDGTDLFDLTYGELEGRRLAEEAFAFVREHVDGFADSFLAGTAMQQGVRETRHIVGERTLRAADVVELTHTESDVAVAAWPQEFHVTGRGTEYRFLPDGASYGIPFGALVPQRGAGPRGAGGRVPTNLLVAGRCISAEHGALASCRVMASCMAMGEAAGTAAALACRDGAATDTVDIAAIDVATLRTDLLDHGAVLDS